MKGIGLLTKMVKSPKRLLLTTIMINTNALKIKVIL